MVLILKIVTKKKLKKSSRYIKVYHAEHENMLGDIPFDILSLRAIVETYHKLKPIREALLEEECTNSHYFQH